MLSVKTQKDTELTFTPQPEVRCWCLQTGGVTLFAALGRTRAGDLARAETKVSRTLGNICKDGKIATDATSK